MKSSQEYDLASFDTIYHKHKESVYRFSCYLTQNTGEAEDLFQETWLRVVTNVDHISNVKNVKSWIYTITANLHRDLLRKKRIRRMLFHQKKEFQSETDMLPVASGSRPEIFSNESDRTDLNIALRQAIKALPVRERQVFILKEIEGFKHSEISGIIGIPEGTVKSLLHRTVKRLQELLSDFNPRLEKV